MPDPSEVLFTAAFDREVRVSADCQRITHRAMAGSMNDRSDELVRWIAFYERMAQQPAMVRAPADVEVRHKARDLLARERHPATRLWPRGIDSYPTRGRLRDG